MQYRFQLDERPPWRDLFLFGLQWLAIAVPSIVIIGGVVAPLHFSAPAAQILYLQKLALVAGLTMGAQILWGHRLPLVTGPAAVLLIGVVASRESSLEVIYGSLFAGALVLTLLAASGLFRQLIRLFTPRIVAVVLLLIAFTLLPTIRNMLVHPGGTAGPLVGLSFAAVLVLLLFVGQFRLRGIWKATLIIWGVLAGSIVWLFLYPQSLSLGDLPVIGLPLTDWVFPGFAFDLGVLLAFLCCFLALAVNDLGSIQAMAGLLQPSGMPGRINRGLFVTGLGNLLAGALGVLGPVNFSLSPGVIVATGCASRYALLPAAGGLLLLAHLRHWPSSARYRRWWSVPSFSSSSPPRSVPGCWRCWATRGRCASRMAWWSLCRSFLAPWWRFFRRRSWPNFHRCCAQCSGMAS